jgi:hypothetical protein
MSEFTLGTNLLGSASSGGSGSTSFMKNVFGARYRGYGTTDVGDDGITSGGIPSIRGHLGRSESVAQMFMAVTQVSNERDKIYAALLEIEDYSLVQTILEIMHDDVLSPDESTNDIFTISSDNEQYDSILKGMEKRLALDEVVDDIVGDLLLLGEYPFKIFTKDNRIAALEEVLVPTDITPIFKGRNITRFLVRSQGAALTYAQSSFESLSPYDFVSFLRYPRKVRLNVQEKYPFLVDGVAKVGRSIFPLETLEKIKSLYLLEKMLPIARVLQLNRSTVVGVQLGQSMMTKSVIEACREYERYLNSQTSSTSYLDINAVISQVGKYKVVPILGEKGTIVEQQIKNDNTEHAMQDILDIRNSIVSSVGLLPSYVFGGDATKYSESLKAYIRYLRKIDSIQKCIINGLKHLCLIELTARGITDAVPSDINVVFANNVSLANIERLEFLDILVSLLNNYTAFIETLSVNPSTATYIDKVEMLTFIKKKLSYLKGAEGAINISDKNEPEDPGLTGMTEDTSEIDNILKGLPREVTREIHNNIIKINKEIRPVTG